MELPKLGWVSRSVTKLIVEVNFQGNSFDTVFDSQSMAYQFV